MSNFKPKLTPKYILRNGFGGTYWRPLKGCVTGNDLTDDYLEFPIQYYNGIKKEDITKSYDKYDKFYNKYKVKTGSTYEFWCEKGWIKETHERGWYQWYGGYYYGKRTAYDDDEIKRWERFAGPKGRFRLHLITKIHKAGGKWDDETISPKLRQNLLEWGYKLTKKDYDTEIKRRSKPK